MVEKYVHESDLRKWVKHTFMNFVKNCAFYIPFVTSVEERIDPIPRRILNM